MLSLYPHQEKAVNDLSNGKILYGDVGTGKSRTAVGYYLKKEAPKDVYVITTAKKRDSLDWEGEFLRGHVSKLERSPDGKRGKLWVDSWNNIANYKNVRGAFFIFDEQRLVGSGAWCKAFEFIAKHNNWILLTGTPGDTWLDYMSVFIANGFYRNRTQFKDEHVVYSTYVKFPKVERYMNEHKLEKLRKELLVHMPMEKHTTRVTHYVPVNYNQELLDKVSKERWNPYLDRPIRSLAEYFYVRRKVVYSDPSRLEAVRRKLTQHPKLIVFYNFDYELEILRKLAEPEQRVLNAKYTGKNPHSDSVYVGRPSKWGNPFVVGKDGSREEVLKKFRDYILTSELMGDIHELQGKDLVCWCSPLDCHADILRELANKNSFAVAEWNGHKHEEIPDTDRWVYLVQYMSGAEGWNCITTDTILFYSLTYSYRMWQQAHGRTDRLNTLFSVLHYHVLLATFSATSATSSEKGSEVCDVDASVLASLKAKKDFNERSFARKNRLPSFTRKPAN
jgi:hypothetical protein